MSLEGRVALITGGGRGIGKAIAMSLAQQGAGIAINYRKDEEAAKATAQIINTAISKAGMYQASIDSFEQCQAMVEAVLRDFGQIDILVNNAGIARRGNSVFDTDPAEMERV